MVAPRMNAGRRSEMGDLQKLGEVIVFQAGDGLPRVDVRFEDETVWMGM